MYFGSYMFFLYSLDHLYWDFACLSLHTEPLADVEQYLKNITQYNYKLSRTSTLLEVLHKVESRR